MATVLRAVAALPACLLSLTALAFQGPLSVPPPALDEPTRSPMFSATRVGPNVVAVGRWGVIAHGGGAGGWRQSKVDVSVDLVDVAFGSDLNGWAVGHGGVVLHTTDAGASWALQLDGAQAGAAALDYYRANAETLPGERRDAVLEQAARWAEEGSTQPFLGVWFKDATAGFIVGSFGRIFGTDDGGQNWRPLIDRIDNPQELHLYAVGGRGDDAYVVGEGGTVWRWDAPDARFVGVPTPYNGSLFGVVVTPRSVLVFGMRGHVFRSSDHGASWQSVPSGVDGGIVSGDVRPNGDVVLVSQAGDILVSRDDGETFTRDRSAPRVPAANVVALPSGWITVGSTGIRAAPNAGAASSPP